MVARRFDVFLVNLAPTVGSEIRKTRPCLIVSPGEMNRHIATVIVAPMTTRGRSYPTRVPCRFQRKSGQIVLDQLLVRRLGRISPAARKAVLATLAEMFTE